MRTIPAIQETSGTSLQAIADGVVRLAQREGYIRPKDVREELERAGESAALWKDVLALARPSLSFRAGRYYYDVPISDRRRVEQDHQASVALATRDVIDRLRDAANNKERRGEERVDFIQPVQVRTEDGRVFTLLSRDFSTSGMRLLGARSLLGQKVQVRLAMGPDGDGWCFVLRVLWTCAVGDELFENGGAFIDARAESPQ
jgi:hypothetical protein